MSRAGEWRLPRTILRFGARPLIMGIVNVTPDSFSDGGQHADTQAALAHAARLIADGADILDIGGESTRPGAAIIDAAEEARRVLPVIFTLAATTDVPISIDTSKASVARSAMAAGAQIINDVTGLEGDPDMSGVALETRAAVCAMHMRGDPRTMQNDPRYENVTAEIMENLRRRRDALEAAGIPLNRICLDPGIGFGKTHEHNLTLMRAAAAFHELGCPLLIGHSRKGFIGKTLGEGFQDLAARDQGTLGASCALAAQGIQILRVHDVRGTRNALRLFEACGGFGTGTEVDR